MDIYINEQKIDFKLEDEKILEDVVSGLIDWTRKDGFQIQEIRYDNSVYSSSDSVSVNTPVEKISRLDVSVKSRIEIHQENLQLLYQYFSLILKAVEAGNTPLIKDLKQETAAITSLLSEFLEEDPNSDDTISSRLKNSLDALDPEAIDRDSENYKSLTGQLTALTLILTERISEIGNPVGELSRLLTALRLSHSELNDISILLQTGKDREALGNIIKFSELSQKALRLYPILEQNGFADLNTLSIEGKNIYEYYGDLNLILSELIEAFTANDYVLIGDLLEYEVSPRLEALLSVLDGVLKENRL